jgi:hypothetical protein
MTMSELEAIKERQLNRPYPKMFGSSEVREKYDQMERNIDALIEMVDYRDKRIKELDLMLKNTERHLANEATLHAEAAKQLEQVREWQPIETAPKDGSEVLVCGWNVCGGVKKQVVRVGRWSSNCWQTGHAYNGFMYTTHWMPLPDPPEAIIGSDDDGN